MADIDKDQEHNEQASPKRREEARSKGQVAQSREAISAAILLSCTILFYFCSGDMVERLMDLTRWTLRDCGTTAVTLTNIQSLLWGWCWKLLLIMGPLLLTVVVAGVLANYLQIGFVFSSEALAPKFDKIDPIKGFQRLFSTALRRGAHKTCHWTLQKPSYPMNGSFPFMAPQITIGATFSIAS